MKGLLNFCKVMCAVPALVLGFNSAKSVGEEVSIKTKVSPSTVSAAASNPGPKAFRKAEGFGKYSKGGRGGRVIFVTTLNDSGLGSLRACLEAKGRRTCIFRVSGDINPQTELVITNPFVTIAGQTAPGQGIQIRQGGQIRNGISIQTHDVVIRHIKVRLGPSPATSDIPDCFQIGGATGNEVAYNVIIDHASCAWATDQLLEINALSDSITVQDSLFYEGLNKATHPQFAHSKGPNFRGAGVSFIRNLIADNVIRSPNITAGKCGGTTLRNGCGVAGDFELRNNLIYNGQDALVDYWNGRGESWVDMVGNVILPGPNTKTKLGQTFSHGIYAVDAWDFSDRDVLSGTSDPMHLCLQDNIGPGLPKTLEGGAPIYGVLNPNDAHLVESTNCYTNPVGPRGMTGPALPSSQVEAHVLANSGAKPWLRDAADARIVAQVAARQGKIIDHPSQVGGWPVMTRGVPYPDNDFDGMSDTWEAAQGITDPKADADGDGYTNLEEFLDVLAR